MPTRPPDGWDTAPGTLWGTDAFADQNGSHFDSQTGRTVVVLRKHSAGMFSDPNAIITKPIPVQGGTGNLIEVELAAAFSAVGAGGNVGCSVTLKQLDRNLQEITEGILLAVSADGLTAGEFKTERAYFWRNVNCRFIQIQVTTFFAAWDGSTPAYDVGIDRCVPRIVSPAFRAVRSGNQSITAGIIETIVYNSTSSDVAFDRGGAFNTSTGEFTAPVAGVWLFAAYFRISNLSNVDDWADTRLRINGTTRYRARHTYHQWAGAIFGQVPACTFQLEAGDTAEVAINLSSAASSPVVAGGGDWTAFSGARVG